MKDSSMRTAVSLFFVPNSLVLTGKYCSQKDEPCPEGADSLAQGQGRKMTSTSQLLLVKSQFFKKNLNPSQTHTFVKYVFEHEKIKKKEIKI